MVWGEQAYEIWVYACADTVSGVDDLRMNSSMLEKLECMRMLVCARNKNGLRILRGHCGKL
jgi:hypothetical protein